MSRLVALDERDVNVLAGLDDWDARHDSTEQQSERDADDGLSASAHVPRP